MIEALVSLLILIGAFFMAVAALGVLRMPDLLIRMHAATKAGTLGASILIVAVAIAFRTMSVTMRCIAIVVFLCLTAPVVAHVVGRAAYFTTRIRLWEGTTIVEVPRDPEQTTR
jgi:multicomponent Na+:H+ antiporter subunit G